MRSSFFHSLTFRLGLLALIALAPVILAAGFLDRDFRQHLNSVALQDAQNQSDHVAAQGREILAGSRQIIFALSRLPEMRRPVASRVSDLLRDIVRQSPHYSVCILFNSRGDFIASSAPEVPPFSAFDRPWFQTVRETLACTQGEFLVSRCSGDPVITQGCPVLDPAGRLVGALAIGTRFDWLQQIGAALALPANSSVCVVDAKGDISAHFPERTAEHAKYIPDSRVVMSQVRQGQTIIQQLGQDGVRRIYAYSVLSSQPGRELYVRVGIPVESIFAPAAASGKRNALALLAAAVLSLLGAGLVARTILRPAGAVLKALRELGAENLSFRVNSKARGELGEVAKAVDAMAEALQLSHASLRSSEQRLRQFLEDVPVSYFVSSVEGRFLEANPAHLRMLGYDSLEQMQAELTDISRQFYVNPKNRALLLEALHTVGCVFQVEHEIYRRDGTTIWAALTARALRNEAGDIIGVQGFSTDITARRQAEMQLQRSNERFLRVLENQADAIFVADAETDMVLFANDAVHRVMGRDVLGRPCWEAVRGGRAQCGKCPRLSLLDEDGEPSGVHTREEHDQASGTWALVRVQAIRWVDGRLARLETITDITDIKRVQEDLHSTSGHLRGILENSPSVITIRDREGRFVLASKRLEEFWDHPASEAFGKTLAEIFPPDIAANSKREDQDILDNGLPLTKITDLPTKNGHVRTMLLSKFPLRDETGAPDKVCTIATDITERVRLERELRAAKEAAEEASRAKSDFLAKVSHEIRTPLSAVLGFSELAEMAHSTEGRNRALVGLRDSGRTLLTLVNDILDLSRVESRNIILERIPFDLRRMMESAVGDLTVEAERKGLRLTMEIGRDVPALVQGDPARLRQILVNLVSNAIKFTQEGVVSVTLDVVGPNSPSRAKSPTGALMGGVQLLLSVQDTGIGIPEDAQHLVFDNFTQADNSTSRKFGGTGLGLAICRQLARFMGGDIWVVSEPGAGSTFFVTLPFALDEVPAMPQAEAKDQAAPKQLRSLHVLLAEDTPANTVIAQAFLRRLGHTCRHAANGQEALDFLGRESFDLVLMDVEMPFMDGLEATRRLRAGEAGELNRFVPVLAMTAHALASFHEQCAEAGMNGFVPKPVSFHDLTKILAGQSAGATRQSEKDADRSRPDLVDLRTALDMLGGHREILEEVLEIFLADLPAKRQALSQAVLHGDLIAMRLAAHSFKSSCASVGALPASRAAGNLEDAAKDGQTALVPGLSETLDSLLEATQEALLEARKDFAK